MNSAAQFTLRIYIMKLIIILLLSLVINSNVFSKEAAKSACLKFFKHIDAKKYKKTWDNSALYFQNAIKKDQWNKSLEAVRTPLGKNRSRKMLSETPKSSLAGAPDGNYIIYQYQSSFENKKHAVETITFTESKDKKWKLVGYFIK